MANTPYTFDTFFASGMEESSSPFLQKGGARWARNLSLKSSILGGLFLFAAFIAHFYLAPLRDLFLVFTYFFAGTRALIETVEDLKGLTINIDVLMTLAAFLSILIGSAMEGGLLLVLFSISHAMEDTVAKKSRSAVTSLRELSPTVATVIEEDGTTHEKAVRDLFPGVKVLVRAGEIVPLDGDVIDGNSFVNLVHLTGENQPVSKKPGDIVQAGSRNMDGTLTLVVTRTSADSTLMQIVNLIHQAQDAKPKLQRFLDRFSKVYATTIISLSAFFAAALPWIFGIPYLGDEGAIYRALAFLIAASPCALIIATPTAYLSAISSCAKKGILLKGGVTLDALARAKKIAFDKTGTLTTGQLTCSKMVPENLEALSIAASLETHANHPIATAIIAFAKEKKMPLRDVSEFLSVPGYGLEATIDGKKVAIGNPEFIIQKLQPNDPDALKKEIQNDRSVVTALLIDKELFVFEFVDQIRENITDMIAALKEQNITSIMLTGDHKGSAKTVANSLGIDEFYADLRPEDKMETVSKLTQNQDVAMVGDGVNDAPALARASCGISMGKVGSGTAIDASDIVLLQDDLSLILWLVKKSRKTVRIVKENLSLALGVIALATTPSLLGYIPLWLAVVLHEGGTLIVGLNSLRLLAGGDFGEKSDQSV